MIHKASNIPLSTILFCIALIPPIISIFFSITNDFDGLYGQDSFAYLNYANVSLREQIFPPPPFYWPPGYPLLVYGVSFITGATALPGQLVSMFAGGMIVFFTGMFTSELMTNHPKRNIAAAISALAMALMGHMWQLSTVIMADTTALAAAVIGMWALARYTHLQGEQTAFWLAIAAAAVGYAVITRWAYAILALICAIHTLRLLWQIYKQSPGWAVRHAILAVMAALIVVGPILLSTLFSADTTYGGNFNYQLNRWDLSNALRRNFVNPDGYENYRLYNGIYYGILPARSFYFGIILAIFAVPGAWFSLRSGRWRLNRLLIGWGLGMFILLIGGAQQNVRFGFAYMPPFAALIGMGVVYALNHIKVWVVISIVFAGILWEIWGAHSWTQNFIDRQQQDYRVVQWADEQLPQHSEVIVFGVTAMMDYYTEHEVYELYYLTIPEIENISQENDALYILLDLTNITTQWRDLSPGDNFRWMQDNLDWERIGISYNFTLYRMSS